MSFFKKLKEKFTDKPIQYQKSLKMDLKKREIRFREK